MPRSTRCLEAALILLLPLQAHAFDPARNTYLLRCGGCHGIEGVSVPNAVPTLRNQVGTLLCTPEGRSYMLHVPNVAMSRINDDLLAQVMNFVAFTLGGPSTPNTTRPFTAAEIRAERQSPLPATSRAAIWSNAYQACARMPGSARASATP